jgi:uncharacterized protein YjdB
MPASITISEGQTVTIPLRFSDGTGAHHAPLEDDCTVEVSNEKVCTAKISKDDASVEIKAVRDGQAEVIYRNEDGSVGDSLMVTVGEPAASQARFHVDGATFAPTRAARKRK